MGSLMDETRLFLMTTEKFLKQTWAQNIISPIFFFERKRKKGDAKPKLS